MKTTNRRDFIRDSAKVSVCVAGSGILVRKAFAEDPPKPAYRTLGSTGYKVTEIGFGAMNTRNAELIEAAIDSGINYLDTAHGYMNGVNEEIVGGIMKTKRNKVFLTTKVNARNPQDMPSMIETSLKRLQTDHVDLLLMHNIGGEDQLKNEDLMKIFDNARKKGQTRFIGFSTHSFPSTMADTVLNGKFWQAVLIAYNYMSKPEVTESINKVRGEGVAVIGMKSLLKMESSPRPQSPPPAAGGNPEQPRGERPRRPMLEDIRKDKDSKTTAQQALIKWVLNNPNVDTVIAGMTAFEQLPEDLAVMGMKMTMEDHRLLRRYAADIKGYYCGGLSGCTECMDKCPNGVAVNEINRCLGYVYGYGSIDLARENYGSLHKSSPLAACSDCTECTVKCVNGLNIAENIRRAKEIFV